MIRVLKSKNKGRPIAPYVPQLRESTILPAPRLQRLREPTADVLDAKIEDEWVEREKTYADVWKSKGFVFKKTTGKILQREIIQIRDKRKIIREWGEKSHQN